MSAQRIALEYFQMIFIFYSLFQYVCISGGQISSLNCFSLLKLKAEYDPLFSAWNNQPNRIQDNWGHGQLGPGHLGPDI